MSALSLASVSYRYPSAAAPSVQDITLSVAAGEVVLLTGPTGCGKSTLLRLATGLLQRHGQGDVTGQITICGTDPAQAAPSHRVRLAGFVSQEPGDQLVSGTVGDELVFAMESAGASPAAMEAAIPRLLRQVGLDVAPERTTSALSGGQTQRLVTGAALSAGAELLLLDEPLAQLDPDGAVALLAGLSALAERGVAVVMVEHRLELALPWCSRLVVMSAGRLLSDTPAADLTPGSALLGLLRRLGLSIPGRLDLADRLPGASTATFSLPPPQPTLRGRVLLHYTDLRHRYPEAAVDALAGVDLTLCAGERVAILGANGAGKSTLLRMLSGRLGRLPGQAAVVSVPQDPDLSLFCPTVRAELAYGPQEHRLPDVSARVAAVAEALSITDLLDRSPQALSRGQRSRVAVAAALSCQPEVLILDEPTAGQDHEQIERMMVALSAALSESALLLATHDVDLALRHATRAVVMQDGVVIADGAPGVVLSGLPADVPLHLPPLATFCVQRGLPVVSAAALAASAEG